MEPEILTPFYAGSRLLTPLCEAIGLPIDQVNFLACQFTALTLAWPYRTFLGPSRASATTRHLVEVFVGVILISFCFGHQILYIVGQSVACYLLMQTLPTQLMPKVVFIGAMTLLCICHIWRQMYDYGGYTLDITGPLMINTQRMSALAWSLRDGQEKEPEKLTANQQQQAIRECPSPLQYVSYIFNFHGVIMGPFCFYKDYIAFIEGSDLTCRINMNGAGSSHGGVGLTEYPSPFVPVVKKCVTAGVCAFITVFIIPSFPIDYISDPAFVKRSIFSKLFYLIVCTTVTRPKYYLAWKLAEAVNNNAGFGYRQDEKGQVKWNFIDNAHIRKVEFSTSIKMLLDNWNITTTYWLRHVVYERVHNANTLVVFFVSSLWHGFYPGYYFTFLTGALFLQTARAVRRHIRPWFQRSSEKAMAYTCLTFLVTRVAVAYMTFPFVRLELAPSWNTYCQMYWFLHIIALIAYGVLASRPNPSKPRAS